MSRNITGSASHEIMVNIAHQADNPQQTEKIALKNTEDAREIGQVATEAVRAIQEIAEKWKKQAKY